MLAESPYRHELESDVEPFRSILLGLFFLSVGMLLDLRLIAARPLFVIGIAAAVIVTKAILITRPGAGVRQQLAAQLSGLACCSARPANSASSCSPRPTAARLILPEAASLFGAVVTLSMATTPFLMRLGRLARSARGATRPTGSTDPSCRPKPARSSSATAASARPSRRCCRPRASA